MVIKPKHNKDIDLTNLARELSVSEQSDVIQIDHLAFSFPLASLRHCKSAGFAGRTSKTQTFFPQMPVPKPFTGKEFGDFEKYTNRCNEIRSDFYERTLKIFTSHVLKMTMSSMRGRGLHGYRDSMTLHANGVEVGFVGIGGQRDTVYFQLSGTACKHLFSTVTPLFIHHWLCKVLGITKLSRIDLAFDCFDNNFNCEYAHLAYKDLAFKSPLGGACAQFGINHKFTYDDNYKEIYTQEMVTVGQRANPIYWRIYNKKLEQGIIDDNLHWYRSEVELKKRDIDCLLNVGQTFSGLCPFSKSLDKLSGVRTTSMTKAKEACLTLASKVKHVRRSAGKALHDILEIFDGDIEKTLGLCLPDSATTKFGLPPTYKKLINQVIEV